MKILLLLILLSCNAYPPPLTCTVEVHHNTCYGANVAYVNITAVGGYEPYTYRLDSVYQSSNIFYSIPSGAHVAGVKDRFSNTADVSFVVVGVGSPECK